MLFPFAMQDYQPAPDTKQSTVAPRAPETALPSSRPVVFETTANRNYLRPRTMTAACAR
ncbi:MAG: hypothetical protein HC876_21480 [Chloroflexaceae bacterium]|nr:hypothetical protein [Chloroflexaceae bacterium]